MEELYQDVLSELGLNGSSEGKVQVGLRSILGGGAKAQGVL